MDVNFNYTKGGKQVVRIEQVFAEKPGGGLVAAPAFDAPATTAVGEANGKFHVIKGYRLYQANDSADTTIKVCKGSGVAKGDVIATGKVGVACSAVDSSNAEYDVVTVKLGVDVPAGTCLYQAKAASADAAEPLHTPVFVTGNDIVGGKGDQPVRLINGANLRKETANVAPEVVALMPGIHLV